MVNGVRGQFLTRSTLALNQNGCPRRGDLFDRLENLHHHWRASDHALERVLTLDLGAEFLVLPVRVAFADSPFDQDLEPVDIHRLCHKIINPALHGLHGGVHRTIGGHHDADRGIRASGDLLHKFHAVPCAQPEVGQKNIRADAIEGFQRAIDIGCHINLEFLLEGMPQPVAGVFLIINNQQRG